MMVVHVTRNAMAKPEPARSADDFVNSIGVCTHWGYGDTPYGYAYPQVKKLLGELGVRHIRDGYNPRMRDLYQTYGIKATIICGPQSGGIPSIIQTLQENRFLTDMAEGPNEVDIFPSSADWEGKGFPEGPRSFQKELYSAIKDNPKTQSMGVIAPSTARIGSNTRLSPMSSMDYVVMHSYAGGQSPETSLYGGYVSNMVNAERILGQGAVEKPIVVTECGYHTALKSGGGVIAGVQPGVSFEAQAKYLPRLYADYFNAGIVRTFSYEFIDEFKDEDTNAEASFGIIQRNLTPKPAYYAIKNLINLLKDAKWDAKTQRWIKKSFHPDSLDFSLIGAPADMSTLRHLLLEKSDGDYYLLIWREIPSFDLKTQQDMDNPTMTVKLRLGTPMRSATAYLLTKGTTPVRRWGATSVLTLQVPDQILVIKLIPKRISRGRIPLAPGNIHGAGTNNTVQLSWSPPKHVSAVSGYFVYRLGKYLGFTAHPKFADSDLQPALGYPYAIDTVGKDGEISAPTKYIAYTTNKLPDLTVTNLTWAPENPQTGDAVTFIATVRNIGDGATPDGVTIGVAFSVDGSVVDWSDTFHASLKPGESVILKADNGPHGYGIWNAIAGDHQIVAHVDDVGRINESNVDNNTLEKRVVVAP